MLRQNPPLQVASVAEIDVLYSLCGWLVVLYA